MKPITKYLLNLSAASLTAGIGCAASLSESVSSTLQYQSIVDYTQHKSIADNTQIAGNKLIAGELVLNSFEEKSFEEHSSDLVKIAEETKEIACQLSRELLDEADRDVLLACVYPVLSKELCQLASVEFNKTRQFYQQSCLERAE